MNIHRRDRASSCMLHGNNQVDKVLEKTPGSQSPLQSVSWWRSSTYKYLTHQYRDGLWPTKLERQCSKSSKLTIRNVQRLLPLPWKATWGDNTRANVVERYVIRNDRELVQRLRRKAIVAMTRPSLDWSWPITEYITRHAAIQDECVWEGVMQREGFSLCWWYNQWNTVQL